MRILYAEDDADDGELLMEALQVVNPDIHCDIVTNGREAIQLLRQTPVLPDYIFLDINMPVMDGKTCLEEIKKTKRLKDIPVVIYSTTKNEEEIADLYALGAQEFMAKPSSFKALCRSLDETIDRLERYIKSL